MDVVAKIVISEVIGSIIEKWRSEATLLRTPLSFSRANIGKGFKAISDEPKSSK